MNRFLVHYTAADRLREIENELKIERGRRPARQGDIISQVSSMNIPEDEIEFSGVVSGETNIGNDIIAILKNMIKGEIRKYPDDEGSMDRMMDNAKFDAEAVIDISFSTLQKNGKTAELLAYLTDIKLRKEK